MRLVNDKLLEDNELSLEKFEVLNTLSTVTNQQDYEVPSELITALEQFVETCIDYKIDDSKTDFINQLLQANGSKLDATITLSSITGLQKHVVNSFIRTSLIRKMNELAYEHERKGGDFDKKLYL